MADKDYILAFLQIPALLGKCEQILKNTKEIAARLDILERLNEVEMKLQEAIDALAAENVKLDDISAKLTEGFTEISTLIGQLQSSDLTPEQEAIVTQLQAKVDAIQPQAQQIADIVPNP